MRYMTNEGYYTEAKPAKGEEPAVPSKPTEKDPTKLVENIRRVLRQTDKFYADFNDKKTDIFLDHAVVDDKTKAILYDDVKDGNGNVIRNYKFTKDGQKKVNEAVKKLMNEEVDVNVRITDGEWKLSYEEKDAFNGIVIPEFKSEDLD